MHILILLGLICSTPEDAYNNTSRFDLSQYTPEEIIVKTVDNKLLVQAKHEQNKDGRFNH